MQFRLQIYHLILLVHQLNFNEFYQLLYFNFFLYIQSKNLLLIRNLILGTFLVRAAVLKNIACLYLFQRIGVSIYVKFTSVIIMFS